MKYVPVNFISLFKNKVDKKDHSYLKVKIDTFEKENKKLWNFNYRKISKILYVDSATVINAKYKPNLIWPEVFYMSMYIFNTANIYFLSCSYEAFIHIKCILAKPRTKSNLFCALFIFKYQFRFCSICASFFFVFCELAINNIVTYDTAYG